MPVWIRLKQLPIYCLLRRTAQFLFSSPVDVIWWQEKGISLSVPRLIVLALMIVAPRRRNVERADPVDLRLAGLVSATRFDTQIGSISQRGIR
jgi:hypothetical protein